MTSEYVVLYLLADRSRQASRTPFLWNDPLYNFMSEFDWKESQAYRVIIQNRSGERYMVLVTRVPIPKNLKPERHYQGA
jgi:hypothetical protein